MNQAWSRGYVTDIPYSHGYFQEMAPSFMRYCLLVRGLDHPGGGQDPQGRYHYCELGYGQGLSANLHAASNPRGQYWGTDFNPDHVRQAQALAREAGLQAHWVGRSFSDWLDDPLPRFDWITLHGVWSWVDEATRQVLVQFIHRHLNPGGVVYLSHNVMPGWAVEKPLRDLLDRQSRRTGSPDDPTPRRIERALAYAQGLRQGRAAYVEQHAGARALLDDMAGDPLQVVAHEYFNRHWQVGYFDDLAAALEAADVQFACSVHMSDLVGEVRQRAAACGLPGQSLDPALRETTHDFLLNRRFRRDLFVRGARPLPPSDRDARLMDTRLVLVHPSEGVSASVLTPYGAVALDAAVLAPLLQALEAAGGPARLGDLMHRAHLPTQALAETVPVVTALLAKGQVWPVFEEDLAMAAAARAPSAALRMNRQILAEACQGDLLRYLASPLTGHAIEVRRADRLAGGCPQRAGPGRGRLAGLP